MLQSYICLVIVLTVILVLGLGLGFGIILYFVITTWSNGPIAATATVTVTAKVTFGKMWKWFSVDLANEKVSDGRRS